MDDLLLLSSCYLTDIDNEGVIDPDNDPPQEMGDDSIEVSCHGVLNVSIQTISPIRNAVYVLQLYVRMIGLVVIMRGVEMYNDTY